MQSTDADRKYYTDRNGPDRRVPQIRKKNDDFLLSEDNLSQLIHW